MLDEIDAVLAATKGLSAEEIMGDYLKRRAIERAIQIISEAAKELPHEVRAEEPDVPWASIIAIGNYLRHEYYRIKMDIMHQIVAEHLPQLRPRRGAPAGMSWQPDRRQRKPVKASACLTGS